MAVDSVRLDFLCNNIGHEKTTITASPRILSNIVMFSHTKRDYKINLTSYDK